MNFYREIFENAPDEIVVLEFLCGRTVEIIILPLNEENEDSKKSTESKDEFTTDKNNKLS